MTPEQWLEHYRDEVAQERKLRLEMQSELKLIHSMLWWTGSEPIKAWRARVEPMLEVKA